MGYTCSRCGASLSEYSSSCSNCGAKIKNTKPLGLGLLTFFLKILFIYMPFCFAAAIGGIYAWLRLALPGTICFLIALGIFLALLFLVRLIGALADRSPKPLSIVLRLAEIILAVGIQFLFFFSISFNFAVPKEVQERLMGEQLTYLETSGHIETLTKHLGNGTLPPETSTSLKTEDLQAILKNVSGAIFNEDYITIVLSSQKNYFFNLFGELTGDNSLRMLMALGISLIIGLVGAWISWRLYKRR